MNQTLGSCAKNPWPHPKDSPYDSRCENWKPLTAAQINEICFFSDGTPVVIYEFGRDITAEELL